MSDDLGLAIPHEALTGEPPGQHWVTPANGYQPMTWRKSGADAYAWTLAEYPWESLMRLIVSSRREFPVARLMLCLRRYFLVMSRVIRVLADITPGAADTRTYDR